MPPKVESSPEAGIRASRRAALLINGRARRGEQWSRQALAALQDGGLDIVDAEVVEDAAMLPEHVEKQVRSGVPLVIVGGGDGTFRSIARLFAHRKTILGVLPLGTGNAFARDLGIPADIGKACDAILHGTVANVDMGLVGDTEFVNVATIGLSTKIALGLRDDMKRRIGRAAYLVSVLRGLLSVKPFRVKLTMGEADHEFDSLQVVIGNGRFHAGPFLIAPDASIDGGLLSIYALASTRKRDFLKMAIHIREGKHVELPEVMAFKAKAGRLMAWPRQRITLDGETRLRTPVDFGIAPAALRVLVPSG